MKTITSKGKLKKFAFCALTAAHFTMITACLSATIFAAVKAGKENDKIDD